MVVFEASTCANHNGAFSGAEGGRLNTRHSVLIPLTGLIRAWKEAQSCQSPVFGTGQVPSSSPVRLVQADLDDPAARGRRRPNLHLLGA